jgi:phage FluMu protein Com
MQIKGRCPKCKYLNTFDQDKLLAKERVFREASASNFSGHKEIVVIELCRRCGHELRIKVPV